MDVLEVHLETEMRSKIRPFCIVCKIYFFVVLVGIFKLHVKVGVQSLRKLPI